MSGILNEATKSHLSRLFWVVIALVNATIIGYSCSFLWDLHRYFSLKLNGVVVEAKVTKYECTRVNKGHKTFALHYEYHDGQGVLHKGKETIANVSASVGDKVKVEYLKKAPQVSRVLGNHNIAAFALFVSLLLLFLIKVDLYALKVKRDPELLFKS